MRFKFIGSLGTIQALLIIGKGLLSLAGVDVSWLYILAPLWLLLFIAVVFWGILGALVSKFGA